MTVSATAAVPTAHASKNLQQLCKHWQHNLQVEFTPDHSTVTFPKDARGADWPGDASVGGAARGTEGRRRAPIRPLGVSRGAPAVRLAEGVIVVTPYLIVIARSRRRRGNPERA